MPPPPASDSNSTAPEPRPVYLWRVLRTYIEQLCNAFGLPSAIAKLGVLSRRDHRDICEWLRPLEALARALIFLDARTITPKPSVETKKRPEAAPRVITSNASINLDERESWRAPFRLGPWAKRDFYPRRKPAQKSHIVPAMSAARRIEALVRAYNEREKFAARLARLLARKATLKRFYLKPKRRIERASARGMWQPVDEAVALCRITPKPARADSS